MSELAKNFQKVKNLVERLDSHYGIKTTLTLSDDDSYCRGGWSAAAGYKIWMSGTRLSTFYKKPFTEYYSVKHVWERFGYFGWHYAFTVDSDRFFACPGMTDDKHIWAVTLHEYAHVLDRGQHGHGKEYCDILYNLIKQFPFSESLMQEQKPYWA